MTVCEHENLRSVCGWCMGKPEPEPVVPPDVMCMIGGTSFRCNNVEIIGGRPCGCNVFKSYSPGKYTCNACGARYVGEK